MRYVIDEASLDLRGFDDDSVLDAFVQFADLLSSLRAEGAQIGLISGWGGLACLNDADIATALTENEVIDRDLGALLLGLLGKCVHWDDDASVVVSDEVIIDAMRHNSFGVAYAAERVQNRKACCVLTTEPHGRRGLLRVIATGSQECDVSFLICATDIPEFLRTIFKVEDVAEDGFLELAARCFPHLEFASSVTFGGFHGGYGVRDLVVDHLSRLNDDFLKHYVAEKGNSAEISSRLGIDVSIESSGTRGSDKLMRRRDVVHEGRTYRCEWHSKLEPHRNRIHFCPQFLGRGSSKILIGMFVEHLPT